MNDTVAVIGLGYVGLPLAVIFANKRYRVIGIDLDERKLQAIRQGFSYLADLSDAKVRSVVEQNRLVVTSSYETIREADIIIICVPTPLNENLEPDLSSLVQVGRSLSNYLKKGQLIVLESSTYPGTTRDVLTPLLESEGLVAGRDIYIAYSPERIDPGNKKYGLEAIPKIVSGLTEACAKRVFEVYSEVFKQVVPVSSPEAAEFTKLLENSYRFVNISFINEIAIICDKMNLDAWEIIEAAGTKPYGFSVFYPGPGIGGHCIPVDPLYLQWKSRHYGLDSRLIDMSQSVNENMPRYVTARINDLMPDRNVKNKNILVVGAAYKRDVNDIRESSAVVMIRMLAAQGAYVSYHDSHVPQLQVEGRLYTSVELSEERLRHADCVVITTDHRDISLQHILDHASLVYDTRNMTRGLSGKARVVRLGAGCLPLQCREDKDESTASTRRKANDRNVRCSSENRG